MKTKVRQKVKILRNKFEKQVSFGHRVFMLRLGHCKNLLLHVHLGLLSVESKTDPKWDRSCLFTRDLDRSRSALGPFLKWTHIVPGKWTTSYRFQEVPCEREAYLDPIWDPNQSLGNRSFGGNLRRLAKIIWGRSDTVSIFEKQVGGVTTRI